MKQLKKFWDNLEIYIMTICMCIFLLNVAVQVITRTVNSPLSWTEEVSRFAFIWMVFMGLSFATRYDKHIRVDVFITRTPPMVQFAVEMLLNALTIVIFVWVLINGIAYVEYCSVVRTPALNIPRAYFVTIIPLSAFLMIIRTLEKIPRDFKRFFGAKEGAV